MTTPTLALGISAAGTREVESLAAAVKQLQGNLTELKNAAGGGGFSNLDNLTKEIQGMRADLAVSLAGLRTELADGFSKMGREVTTGGEITADALSKVKVRLSVAAQGLGDGVKASISASGLQSKEALVAMAAEVSAGGDAVAAAAEANKAKIAALRARSASSMNEEDTRALLGMPSRAEMAASTALIKAQMLESMAVLKAQVSTQPVNREFELLARTVRASIGQAMQEAGTFSSVVGGSFGKVTEAVGSNSHALQLNQRFWREGGTEINEIVQGRWNRAIGTISSMANALGVFTFLLSPGGAILGGFVALGAAVAALVVHGERTERALISLQRELEGTGRGTMITRAGLEDLIKSMADLPGVSKTAAESILSDFTKAHNISAPLMRDLALSVADYAAATGTTAEVAGKTLAKIYEEPTAGAKELQKAIGALTANQMAQITLMGEAGDMAGQQRVLLEAQTKATHDLAHEGTELQKAETEVGVAWNHLVDSWGKSTIIVTITASVAGLVKALADLLDKSKSFSDFSSDHPIVNALLFGVNNPINVLGQAGSFLNKGFKNPAGGSASFESGFVGSDALTAAGTPVAGSETKDGFIQRVMTQNERFRAANRDLEVMKEKRVELLKAIADASENPAANASALKVLHQELDGVNAALAKKAGPAATQEYRNALKDLTQTLSEYAQQEKVVAETERSQAAVLKAYYDSGSITFADYQRKLTDIQNTGAMERMRLAVEEESTISAKLEKLRADAARLASVKTTPQQVLDKAQLDVRSVEKQLDDAHLKVTVETNKEYERQLQLQVQALAPAKAILDNADKELDKLQKGMALDVQKLNLKTNISQLSEKDQYVQEKVLAATQATTDALFNAQEVVKKLSADGGIWAGLTGADFEDGSPAAKDLAKMLDYIDKLKASLADMKPKLHDAFALDFDAAKIGAMTKSLQSGLADAIMNAGHDGGKGLIKVLQDELLKKPFKILLEGALQGISGSMASAAYSLFGGGNTGGGSVGGLLNMASTGSNLFSTAGSLYTVGSQYLGGTMSGANAAGTIYANATGGGIDGLLATNGAYGTAGGVATELGGSTALTAGGEAAGYAGLTAETAGTLGGGASVAGGAALATEAGATAGATAATGALAAIPVVGWVALAAVALYSIFGGKGGGPKTEAGYAPNGMDISGTDIEGGHPGSQRGDVAAAKTISDGISGSYKSIADQLGVVNDKLDVGVFYAQDPQGTSQTQLQVVGGAYDRSKQMGGIENVDRGDQALKDAIALSTAQLILTNLQSADIKGKVGEYIKQINPAGTAEQINASLQLAANAQSMYTAFGKLGPKFTEVTDMSVEGINGLITAMGGMDKAAQSLSDYYNNFYSAAEQRTVTINNIVKTLSDAGLNFSAAEVGSASKQQFRQLVESLDLTTAEGQKTFAVLMSVEGAFSSLSDKASQFTDYLTNFFSAAEQRTATVAQITKTLNDAGLTFTTSQVAAATRAQFRQVVESLDLTTEAGQASYDAMMSVAGAFASITNASTVAQTALDNLNTAQNQVIASYQQQVASLKTFVTDIQKYLNDLALGSLSPLTPAQKYAEAEQQFQDTLAKAQGGDTTAQGQLTNAANNLLTASQAYNASSQAYTDDYNMVQAALHNTVAIATTQEATMNDQLSALNVVNTSVLSVKDAIENLARAIAAIVGAGGTVDPATAGLFSGGGGYQSPAGATLFDSTIYTIDGHSYTVGQARNYIQGLISDGNVMGAYNAFKSSGVSLSDADTLMGWAAGTATQWALSQHLPTFGRGTNNVPSDMLALIHKDERIIPAADNRILMHKLTGGSSDTSNEIRALRIEFVAAVKELHKDNNTGHAANAIETSKAREAISGAMHTSVDKQISHERSKQRSDIQ